LNSDSSQGAANNQEQSLRKNKSEIKIQQNFKEEGKIILLQ
jgi:hypothetical protein